MGISSVSISAIVILVGVAGMDVCDSSVHTGFSVGESICSVDFSATESVRLECVSISLECDKIS